MEEKLVLIDTDAGLDDCLAILMALQAHKDPDVPFRVIGINCVNGNTEVDNVTVNVTRILEVAKVPEIPIYRGMESPIVRSANLRFNLHGSDGFGNVKFPPIQPKIEDESGVNALIRLAHKHRGKLTVLALGPLTNLAMAVRLDPSIKDCLRAIYLMGGMIEAATSTGEFNFVVDPEAAHIVLTTFTCPIVIVPMEVGQHVRETINWRVNILGKMATPECDLMNKIEANALEARWKPTGRWISYDSTATAVLVEPSITKKKDRHQCSVELHGNHSRGQLIVDPPTVEEYDNISIVKEIDGYLFRKMLLWAVGGPFYQSSHNGNGASHSQQAHALNQSRNH